MKKLLAHETLYYNSLEELKTTAEHIISFSKKYTIWTFRGQMGSGKTTLIKEIGKQMGIENTISSPTFSIVNEYENQKGEVFYHFDFYRIKKEEEILDIGLEHYLTTGTYCWIEWPDKIESFLLEKYIEVKLELVDHQKRLISLSVYE